MQAQGWATSQSITAAARWSSANRACTREELQPKRVSRVGRFWQLHDFWQEGAVRREPDPSLAELARREQATLRAVDKFTC